jgi:hypothetical protein
MKGGKAIRSADELAQGDAIVTKFLQGEIERVVKANPIEI